MKAKTDSIHVLHVEDEPDFSKMAAEFLEREDDRISVQTTTNAREALDDLADFDIDCIVSDYDMPGQNGIEFLETVREERPDLPFILYTGKGSEVVASEAISSGVTDYLQKESGTEQYEILANEIVSAVQKYRTERELDDLRRRYTTLVEQNLVGIYIIQHGKFVYVNPRLAAIHGYDDPEEIIGLSPLELVASEERDRVQTNLERRLSGEKEEIQYQTIGLRKDGDRINIELHGTRTEFKGEPAIMGAELDITDRKERERVLSEEKEKYSTLVEQSHDGILVLQDAEIKFVNEQAENISGFEEHELLGKPFLEIVAPQDRDRILDRYQRRLDPETESAPAQYDLQFLTKGGEHRYANISAAKIQFEGESADLVTFRDISEQKENTRQLETLINNLPGIVYRARNDPDWPMEFVKGECESLTGYSAAAIEEGEVIWGEDVVHPEDQQEAWEAVQHSIEEGRPFEITYRIRTKDGATKWVWERGQIVNYHISDAEILEGFITGITERKEHEEELQRHNKQLQEFANVVSHDLRNPLNVAQERVKLAQKECDTEHLDAAGSGVERSLELIDDMLDLASAGQEVSDTEPVAVEYLVDACWDTVETPDATVVADFESTIRADRTRLRQLLENLFRNAVEHGGEDLTVRVGPMSTGFYVEDDGPGIPEDKRGGVWESGYSRTEEGTGLGLSIVKQIVEAHGWDIRITEGSDGGARFEITGVEVSAE